MSNSFLTPGQAGDCISNRRLNGRERVIFVVWLAVMVFLAAAGGSAAIYEMGTHEVPLWAWFAAPVFPILMLAVISRALHLPERFLRQGEEGASKE